jgi:hypothetical protein
VLLDELAPQPDNRVSAKRLLEFPDSGSAYAIVQVERADAVILTYSCDIDRGLENIVAGNAPAPVELITVTAVRPVGDHLKPKLDAILKGDMPRFALIPATIKEPELLVDFSSIQQISLRVLVPIAFHSRRHSVSTYGQLKLLERMAHALGDQFRRVNAVEGSGDLQLFAKAYEQIVGSR